MVNYCCVWPCGRNSRENQNLTFYSLPKGIERRKQWLLAAGRVDLLEGALTSTARFCSIHFPPAQIRGKNLSPDAAPSLYLAGSVTCDIKNLAPEKHNGIVCNSCSDSIVGFRYKCIMCPDVDLCQKCEMLEVHHLNHLMIRIARPKEFKKVDSIIVKLRDLLNAEDPSDDNNSDNDNDYQSSDDEPITKYAKTYDSGVDLSDDMKRIIRNEVDRVIKVVNKQKELSKKRPSESNKPSKRLRTEGSSNIEEADSLLNPVQELAFADVGDIKLDKVIKHETIVPSCDLQNSDIIL
ncbi:uncharacterized protein [Epargyreus clarus]|uniref:uncharacterized protein n=1 Tax=Epargyreus clarus TaxID=520877 RepID=UPI003C2F4D83